MCGLRVCSRPDVECFLGDLVLAFCLRCFEPSPVASCGRTLSCPGSYRWNEAVAASRCSVLRCGCAPPADSPPGVEDELGALDLEAGAGGGAGAGAGGGAGAGAGRASSSCSWTCSSWLTTRLFFPFWPCLGGRGFFSDCRLLSNHFLCTQPVVRKSSAGQVSARRRSSDARREHSLDLLLTEAVFLRD